MTQTVIFRHCTPHAFERQPGLCRNLFVAQGANPDEIEATMRDGVLTVTLPVPEEARPRRIQIQS